DLMPTRRAAIKSFGAIAAGALGFDTEAVPDADGPIIDSHFHLVNTRLPGLPGLPAPDETVPLAPFDPEKQPDGARKLARAIEEKFAEAGVGSVLCMPRAEVSDRDPLGIKEIEAVAALVKGPKLYPVGLAHPERFDRDHLARVEEVLRAGRVKALKVYLGYLHYGPDHPGYRPVYKLAGGSDGSAGVP